MLFTGVALIMGGVTAVQADDVIANADFSDQIPGTNKPEDWSDIGGNVLAMNGSSARLNLSLPNAARTLSPTTFRGVRQTVDLTGVQSIVFDARALSAAPDWVEIAVRIGSTEVWSASQAGNYKDQVIDVSGYSGAQTLSLRIQSTVSQTTSKPSGISANFYFDNLRSVVGDTTAPTVAVAVGNEALWSPNHKLVDVGLDAVIEDAQDVAPTVAVLIYSNEPNDGAGDGSTDGDAVVGEDGSVSLRAERSGQGEGRVYLIVVAAVDEAGNTGFDCATVIVPKSKSRKDVEAALATAVAAEDLCLLTGEAPAGWFPLN